MRGTWGPSGPLLGDTFYHVEGQQEGADHMPAPWCTSRLLNREPKLSLIYALHHTKGPRQREAVLVPGTTVSSVPSSALAGNSPLRPSMVFTDAHSIMCLQYLTFFFF